MKNMPTKLLSEDEFKDAKRKVFGDGLFGSEVSISDKEKAMHKHRSICERAKSLQMLYVRYWVVGDTARCEELKSELDNLWAEQ